MGGHQTVRNLPREIKQCRRTIDAPEWRTLDELHNEVVRPNIVELADVRMVQRGYRSGFTFETLGELLLGNLDGDEPVETGVFRPVHLAL